MTISSATNSATGKSAFPDFTANTGCDYQQGISADSHSSNDTGQVFSSYLEKSENRDTGNRRDHASPSNCNDGDHSPDRSQTSTQDENTKPHPEGMEKSKKARSLKEKSEFTKKEITLNEALGTALKAHPRTIHAGPLSGSKKVSVSTQIPEIRLQEIPGLTALRCGTTDKGLPSVMMELQNHDSEKTIIRLDLVPGGTMALTVNSATGEPCRDLGNILINALREAGMNMENMQGRQEEEKGWTGGKGGYSEGERQNKHFANPFRPESIEPEETTPAHKHVQELSQRSLNPETELLENYFPYSIKTAIISLHETGYFSPGSS